METEFGFDYTKLKTYSGYYLDNKKLKKSASGGAASVIAEEVIEDGGVVFGAVYSEDYYQAEYYCAETIGELERLKGSKYVETNKKIAVDGGYVSAYEVLEKKLKDGKKCLYIGLGCDIGAVYKVCEAKKINTSRLYTVELICHGPTTNEVHSQYIKGLEKTYNSKVVGFSVRYKKEGWIPPYIHAEFANGEIFETTFNSSDYGIAFSRYSKSQCYNCMFRGENHKADIIVGDFWGLDSSMEGFNREGVSILFVRTDKGMELVQRINTSVFYLREADSEFALKHNTNLYKCRKKAKNYDKFARNLSEKNLHYAVQHRDGIIRYILRKYRIKEKIKRICGK